MDQERQVELVKRIDTADRVIKVALGALIGLIVVMLIIVIFQLFAISAQVQDTVAQVRSSQLANQASGAVNHKKTQAYVLCVATTLTIPIANRKANAIEACTAEADKQANN